MLAVIVTGWRSRAAASDATVSCRPCSAASATRNSRSPSGVDLPVAALQQRDAEMRLERVDLAADRRLRDAQVLRGERDAHAAADRDETADEIERRKTDERR